MASEILEVLRPTAEDELRALELFEKYADHAAHDEHGRAPTLATLREKFPIWTEEREVRIGELWLEIKAQG